MTNPNAIAGPTTGLHALFSFNIPSSLFPPSAIISLTDDNSTFFLARPAAFGPLLPEKGQSGQLWVGSSFGDGGPDAGVAGELGCSDIPGWRDGDTHRQDTSSSALDKVVGKAGSGSGDYIASQNLRGADSQYDSGLQSRERDQPSSPSTKDGTDDHLHHPLPESGVADGTSGKRTESGQLKRAAHADIQSLQESAEIAGKVVLLSRGGCGFLEKVKWVQRRGGSALIVGDDTRGGGLITMYARGDTSNITIPSLFTSHTTAQLLSSLVPPQAGEDASPSNGSKGSSRTKPSAQSGLVKQGSTTGSTARTAMATDAAVTGEPIRDAFERKAGIFHNMLSLLGLRSSDGRAWPLPEDSRRPPSSGNIDWIVLDSLHEDETTLDSVKSSADISHSKPKPSKVVGSSRESESQRASVDGDGFVIGVQDWRDRDVISPTNSAVPKPSRTLNSQANEQTPSYAPASLKGGSRTPGSGEYQSVEFGNEGSGARAHQSMAAPVQSTPPKTGKNWFSKHFTWTGDKELDADQSSTSHERRNAEDAQSQRTSSPNHRMVRSDDHEGLWVTLTPTSMSTSPFFDTLLVLVVSPLVTLTVVYALLLLRARIRRRRWRAPKSVVDRLPVRTYHTIVSSSSSSSVGSVRSASPETPLPTSPLLGSGSRSREPLPRPRSQTMSGVFRGIAGLSNSESSNKEKSYSRSSRWQRKYTGRQLECVVCLEEYVDGQSRVMSLPCGHEFHAECM